MPKRLVLVWRAAGAGRCAVCRLPALSRRLAGVAALGIFLAALSCHLAESCLVCPWTEDIAQRTPSAALALEVLCAGCRQFLDRAADPHRLLRPAHVLRASLGAFCAASCRRVLHCIGHERAGALGWAAGFPQAGCRRAPCTGGGLLPAASGNGAVLVRGAAVFLADSANPYPGDAGCQSL